MKLRLVRYSLAAALTAGGCAVAASASAQEAPTGLSRPTIDVSVPPPAVPVVRQARQHEGFYLRANLGIGGVSGAADIGSASSDTRGMNMSVEALVGGSPGPGFSLGGAVSYSAQLSGSWDGGEEGAGDLNALMIGPFVDGFPNPVGGWHFGGTAGLVLLTSSEFGNAFDDALGFGGAAWLGHDVWVSPEWSVGGQFRLDAMRGTATEQDVDLTVSRFALSLQFSVLYN